VYVSFLMKNDTPKCKRGQRLLREQPELLIELLREQTKTIQSLHEQIERQNQLIEQLREELTRSRQQFEEAQRAAHRQAAPFRIEERQRKQQPGRPGRAAGHPGARRKKPEHIDQTIDVPLERCPRCGGPLHEMETVEQFIDELPPIRPTVYRLLTRRACCPHCGNVASTHPLQTTTASGAAGVHLGPRALAVALDLNREMGLTMRKTCRVLAQLFGLKLSPGGLAQAAHRLAGRLSQPWGELRRQARTAPVIHADETGWWLGGAGRQLWVFTHPGLTLYHVRDSRGRAVIHDVLGADFAGVLVSDCLSSYDDATAVQQKCYSHHLKAIAKAIQAHAGGGEGFLQQIKALLKSAMLFKKLKPQLPASQWPEIRAGLTERAARLLLPARGDPLEEAVANRLRKQQDHLFTFLDHEAVEATNNLAERQLRPAVISRKLSAGNKTERGARTWEILASLAATYAQRRDSFIDLLTSAAMLNPSTPR
jgi:transposase